MEKEVREARRAGVALVAGCAAVAFLAVAVAQLKPPDPEIRLPREYRLAGLIERQQETTAALRAELAELRGQVERLSSRAAVREEETAALDAHLRTLSTQAGLVPMAGPGLEVSLTDSDLDRSPSGNVNDLVIHSEDVRAVVNALYRAGADAISVNGQRLVATSAVVCVGNTLLVNGTVHSPPYVAVAIGANRTQFETDRAVRTLKRDAVAFRLGFSVKQIDRVEISGFEGAVSFNHARPQATVGPGE